MRLLEKSKSIYEYGSYVYYETGSPAFWWRHCRLSVSGKIPDVTYPVPAVDTCRNSCCTCHHSGRVVVPASGCRFRTSSSFFQRRDRKRKVGKALLSLHATGGTIIRYYYWFSNFLVYGGAGSGKTKSIGKPLMEQYIRSGFAGFIYDFKDFDYTRTAYNLIRKHGYPHEFYYVNFTDMNRTYRFNPLDRRNIKDRTMLMQLMEDVLGALMPPTSKQDEWYTGALGILNGVAYRLWDEFPECCTLPHIVNFVMKADTGQLQEFLKLNDISAMMAGAYLKAEGSEKTQASYVSTLSNYVAKLATNENICYVLTGNDFDFNLIDPEHPKLFAISNNYATESVISPVIAMVMSIASRSFSMENRVPFVFILDEMTTFKVRDFEKLPSVLREYGAAFLLLTQSEGKLEKLYSKLDRSSIETNFGNIFLGRTLDVEALKYYPFFSGNTRRRRSLPAPAAAVAATIPA